MFQRTVPIFRSHTVLKAAALSEGMNEASGLIEQIYQGYSDGIITGADIIIEGKDLIIKPGIIKYNKVLYQMKEEERIPYQADGKTSILWLQFLESQEREDKIQWNTSIYLTEKTENRNNDMELCRFTLKEGAVLRQDYKNFHDMATEHNTLNIIEAPYAGIGEHTVSPIITEMYGNTLAGMNSKDPLDMAFMLECLKGVPVARKILLTYIRRKLPHIKKTHMANREIYESLKIIIDNIKRTGGQAAGTVEVKRRMIID